MICRLCEKDRELRESHIIPEFFYRPGYDGKGRILAIPGGENKPRFLQKGLREKLLCSECEQFLNHEYEHYFSLLWYEKNFLPDEAKGDIYCIEGIDYARFKLFLLSILWRASISRRDEFSKVSLGLHEAKIRQMLLDIQPKDEQAYQIFGVLLLLPASKQICGGLIMPPIRSRFEARHVYIFVFGGCAWHYVVASHPVGPPIDQVALTEQGSMKLPTYDLREFKPVDGFMRSQMHIIKRAGWKNPWRK